MTETRTRSTASRPSEPTGRWTSARPRATDPHPTPGRLVDGPSPLRAGIWRDALDSAAHPTGRRMKTRNALLIVTAELLAATLSLALPNLVVEILDPEEVAQTRTLTSREKQPTASSPTGPAIGQPWGSPGRPVEKLPKAALGIASSDRGRRSML